MGFITKTGIKLCLIYDFSWGGLNKRVNQAAPKEAMRFRRALHRILYFIPEVDPSLGKEFISKVDLADTYMHIWVRLTDIPYVAFLVLREREDRPATCHIGYIASIGY